MSLYTIKEKYVSFNEKLFDTEKELMDYYENEILYKYRMGTSTNPNEVIQLTKFILKDRMENYNISDIGMMKQYTAETTPTSRFPVLKLKITYIAEDKKNNFRFLKDYDSFCGFNSISEFVHIIEETFEKFISSKEYKLLFGKKNKK